MKCYKLDGEIASFDFHDESGMWAYCGPKSLKAFLDDLKTGEKAEIEISSPGGSVISGIEMANAIKNSGAHLIAHVTGMAASMASVIACACDEIIMEEASFMMIHDPWAQAEGNADELRKQANLLDQMKSVIMSFYRGKFACSEDELAELMSDETWYTGSECLEHGLTCTVVKSDVRAAAKVGVRSFAKMPEVAKAFYNAGEMPDDIKAAVEAARAAAETAPAASDTAPAASDTAPAASDTAPAASDAAPAASDTAPAASDTAPAASETAPAASDAAPAGDDATSAARDDWEARYKGASKKINELQAKIEAMTVETVDYGAVVAERDALKNQIAALEETAAKAVEAEKNFKDQLEKAQKDLAEANAQVSGLKGDLEKSVSDLAACRERAEQLEKTRDLLTGGVLSVSEGETYAAKMAAAKTPEEREALRTKKARGKID